MCGFSWGLNMHLAPMTASNLKMLSFLCWSSSLQRVKVCFHLSCLRLGDDLLSSPDHQAFWHCYCPHAGPTPASHHEDHGLRAAAVSEESQCSEDWPGKRLYSSFLAGIFKTDDCRKLFTEFTGWWFNNDGLGGDSDFIRVSGFFNRRRFWRESTLWTYF